MIVLTENAATRIEQIRSEVADDSKYLRLSVKTGGCSGLEYGLSFDYKKDDDIVDDKKRMSTIVDLVVSLNNRKDFVELIKSCREIVEHNFQMLKIRRPESDMIRALS